MRNGTRTARAGRCLPATAAWWIAAAVAVIAPAGVAAQGAPASASASTRPTPILDGSGVWRVMYSWNAPLIQTADGLKERRSKRSRAAYEAKPDFRFMTQYPPADWTAPDFDDASWSRRHFFVKWFSGEWDHRAGGGAGSAYLRRLSLRGKFAVADPSKAAGLRLSLAYRGGAIVYLNGTEIARGHMPAGNARPDPGRPGEIYPLKAYCKDDGKPWSWWTDRDVVAKQCYPHRVRKLGRVAVPAKALRKGVNVLAIEIHAAPYPEVFMKAMPQWATCGLIGLQLAAETPDGLTPNIVRPTGFRVWNTNPAETIFDVDWPDPNEPVKAIAMAGPRNGCCSGRVAVSSDRPLKNLHARVSRMVGPAGKALPASAVEVRYGRFDARRGSRWGGPIDVSHTIWGDLPRLQDDALVPTPPDEVPVVARKSPYGIDAVRRADGLCVHPPGSATRTVWVVANLPADAAPGDYRGTLTITAHGGHSATVPVGITVIDWRAPDPADYASWVGMIQSPEAVAMTYKVAPWSAKHAALVARSLAWVGRVGPKVLYVPVGAESQYGNAESMVVWVKGADGQVTHDFSRVEKYVDLALKHMGRPRFVVVGVWDSCMHISSPKASRRNFPRYSVRDAKTGQIIAADGPKHGSDEALAFWKPVLTAIRAILAKRGLADAMVLGYVADKLPTKETVEVFRKILPQTGWQSTRHSGRGCEHLAATGGNVPVYYHANVWGGWNHWDPLTRRVYGWRYRQRPSLRTWLDRDLFDGSAIVQFRTACEQAILADRHGLGQIGADFWPVKATKTRRGGTMVGRFPATSEGNLGIYAGQLLYAGPDGPEPTARYQMMRENVQECEARIHLEKLLTAKPCPLPAGVAKRCQDVLDERTRWHRTLKMAGESFLSWPHSGWEARSAKLFAAAAEAAKAPKAGPVATAPKGKPRT